MSRRLTAGMAGADLAAAAGHAGQCVAQQGALAAAWKLLGDVHLQHHSVTPASATVLEPSQKCVPRCLRKLETLYLNPINRNAAG